MFKGKIQRNEGIYDDWGGGGESQDRILSTGRTRQMEGHSFCHGWNEEERLGEVAGEFCK